MAQKLKNAYNAGDLGSIPGSGRSSGEGNGNPFQHSCLEDPTDREAWQTTVHGIAKSQTRLRDYHTLTLFKIQGILAAAGGIGDAWTWGPPRGLEAAKQANLLY